MPSQTLPFGKYEDIADEVARAFRLINGYPVEEDPEAYEHHKGLVEALKQADENKIHLKRAIKGKWVAIHTHLAMVLLMIWFIPPTNWLGVFLQFFIWSLFAAFHYLCILRYRQALSDFELFMATRYKDLQRQMTRAVQAKSNGGWVRRN